MREETLKNNTSRSVVQAVYALVALVREAFGFEDPRLADSQAKIVILNDECEKLRVIAAAEKKTADEIHAILGQVVYEAQEREREHDEIVVRLMQTIERCPEVCA